MCNTYLELATWAPRFVGQKAYCAESRRWYVAVKSCSGAKLVWLAR